MVIFLKTKNKKNGLLNSKTKVLSIIIMFLLVIVLCLIYCIFNYNSHKFKIESRDSNIKKVKSKVSDEYEIAGWVRVQGTNIDYPILGEMKKNQTFPVEIEKYSWIQTGDNKYHNVVNIYGHNILNLSSNPINHDDDFNRFEELMNFIYYDFAKENRFIQLTMNGNDYIYEIFAVGINSGYVMNFLPIKDYSKDEINNYLSIVKNNSIYDYDLSVSDNDKFITLVTCTRFFGNTDDSFYVSGKLRNIKKLKTNSKVTKNNNYKNVEDVLKGDEKNEK